MVSKETKDKLTTGFGSIFTVVGFLLLLWSFFISKDLLGESWGPGELFTSMVALGVMFAVAVFLIVKGTTMLR